MRINRFLTEHGICSRREGDRWVEAGRITINAKLAVLGDQVNEDDTVAIDGKPVVLQPKRPVVLAYHKPIGIECTSDPRVQNNIIEAVAYPERVFHIGRLDIMSQGLILLTNLGDLVNKILRSHYAQEKEYVVVVDRPLSTRDLTRLRKGVDIGDGERGPTKPCHVDVLGENRMRMILTEGRNRQIRRMMDAIGARVVRLKRIRIMNISLGTLPSGQWRPLTDKELNDLTSMLSP